MDLPRVSRPALVQAAQRFSPTVPPARSWRGTATESLLGGTNPSTLRKSAILEAFVPADPFTDGQLRGPRGGPCLPLHPQAHPHDPAHERKAFPPGRPLETARSETPPGVTSSWAGRRSGLSSGRSAPRAVVAEGGVGSLEQTALRAPHVPDQTSSGRCRIRTCDLLLVRQAL